MWSPLIFLCIALSAEPPSHTAAANPSALIDRLNRPLADELTALQLPPAFLQRVQDRVTIDQYQLARHRVEPGISPTPLRPVALRRPATASVRTVRPRWDAVVEAYRTNFIERRLPLRGYRAPILRDAADFLPIRLDTNSLSPLELKAGLIIHDELPKFGLLRTLVRAVSVLGPERIANDLSAATRSLQRLGFPADLMQCWQESQSSPSNPAAEPELLGTVARALASGTTPSAVERELAQRPFRFVATRRGFKIAAENGDQAPGLIRAQVRGGYDRGITPGGMIDVLTQLHRAFPEADFLLTAAREVMGPMHGLISRSWHLRRSNQVTMVESPVMVGAWAQDNGKAGLVEGAAGQLEWATLTPRYASLEEGRSIYEPSESYLMDGLSAAGHRVLHSSLLFQGGNLMALRHPATGERILLVGEGEIHRNRALGLSHAETSEALRVEFGVDRCVEVPAVSYHLDFDVSARTIGDQIVLFVNNPDNAAQQAARDGLSALARAGLLTPAAAQYARESLETSRNENFLEIVRSALSKVRRPDGEYPATVSALFAVAPPDQAEGNLQTFLLALDWIESGLNPPARSADEARRGYLEALVRMRLALQAQRAALERVGGSVVAVPSMPDLHRSLNYLNGLQHAGGYAMPAHGGFYAALDQVAAGAFRAALGEQHKIIPIQCADLQRLHGGLHCAASVYPRLNLREPL